MGILPVIVLTSIRMANEKNDGLEAYPTGATQWFNGCGTTASTGERASSGSRTGHVGNVPPHPNGGLRPIRPIGGGGTASRRGDRHKAGLQQRDSNNVPSGIRSEGAWIYDLADGNDGGLRGIARETLSGREPMIKVVIGLIFVR